MQILLLEIEVPNEETAVETIGGPIYGRGSGCGIPQPTEKADQAPKGRTFEERRRTQLKFNKGIRDGGLELQLRLGRERAVNKTFGQTLGLEVAKRVVGTSTGLREVSDWILWKGQSPPKRKKRPRKRTKIMVVHLNRLAPNQGTTRDERP
jgi:hypothetical protein